LRRPRSVPRYSMFSSGSSYCDPISEIFKRILDIAFGISSHLKEKKIQKEVFQLSKDWIFYFIAMQILRVARKRVVRTVQ
jgi:hypothetical protein